MNTEELFIKVCSNGEVEKLVRLIKAGFDINYRNNYGLHIACWYGHYPIVKLLVENGVNIHSLNECALRWASINGYSQIVEYLIRNGADVNIAFNHTNQITIIKSQS
jgi:ankyrin repeat protein